MIQRILVAYDDGVLSQKALDTAIEVARSTKAEIIIASSLDMPLFISSPGMLPPDNIPINKNFIDNNLLYFEKFHNQAAARVKENGIAVTTKVLEGSPGKSLIRYAEEIQADLIAVGSNNKGVLDRLFLGSVSNYIVHHAKCMVLLVKN
jgi:nucleotide-binding universal stress UspA family protein